MPRYRHSKPRSYRRSKPRKLRRRIKRKRVGKRKVQQNSKRKGILKRHGILKGMKKKSGKDVKWDGSVDTEQQRRRNEYWNPDMQSSFPH
ncbi:Protein of unknown function [Gryllus bimaculatus]|nr:Protein of unknown function [Gryllus bimaculatus]